MIIQEETHILTVVNLLMLHPVYPFPHFYLSLSQQHLTIYKLLSLIKYVISGSVVKYFFLDLKIFFRHDMGYVLLGFHMCH